MRSLLTAWLVTFALLHASCPLRSAAQERRPLTLALRLEPAAQLDGEQLRAQLERELRVVVVTGEPTQAAEPALRIEAPSRSAVRVAFGASERTVDLSTTGEHAVETLALLAANLMRDEARDLLATLRATEPEPVASTAAASSAVATAAPAPAVEPQRRERRGCDPSGLPAVPYAVNFLPHLGTSTYQGTNVEQGFALNVIGGSASALRGFELAGIFNHESDAVCGVQIAGGANIVAGPVAGAQLAALNVAGGRVEGAQLGFANLATGPLEGVQLGFANVSARAVDGVEAGFVNVAAGTVRGGQLGFVNVARGGTHPSRGSAVATEGVQVGFVNTAAGDSHGVQLGFANVTAGQSRGLMLGLVNVADDADAPIGLLNIHLKGRTQLDVWMTDAALAMVGVEHGGRVVHNIFGVGYTSRSGQGVFAFAYGLGARAHDGESFFLDLDAVGYGLLAGTTGSGKPTFGSILQLRVPLGWRIARSFSLFMSPELNVSVARTESDVLREPGLFGARLTKTSSPTISYLWPGLSLGARFF